MKIPKVILHPVSVKYLKLGNPWVTKDSFTEKFPINSNFLIGVDKYTNKEVALLIHDPDHKKVKARLFKLITTQEFNFNEELFFEELNRRIEFSFSKRVKLNLEKQRENYYLINAESDFIPGVQVLKLKDQLIIQYYSFFWKKYENQLIGAIKNKFQLIFNHLNIAEIWIQERNFNQKNALKSQSDKTSCEFSLREFDINYQIKINENYDFGIYTDMSAIRHELITTFQNKKNILNLYCYTGAFSLFSLKFNPDKVVSVDLSKKYLDWLDSNLELNPTLNKNNHESLQMPTDKALIQLKINDYKFDFIICDPPSASNDGETVTQALKSYELNLLHMLELLDTKGELLIFLNTHQISFQKFEDKIKQIIEQSIYKNKIIIKKRFKMLEDCAPLKGHHESDYLKGLLIAFK